MTVRSLSVITTTVFRMETVRRENGIITDIPTTASREDVTTTAHRTAITVRRENGEVETLIKTARKIIRITALIPIIIKVIEITVDSIQIARRNLKED